MHCSRVMASPQRPGESVTQYDNFEAMFVRALKPDPALRAALKDAGFDLARPQPMYPTRVWQACLEVARRHAFPEQAPGDAFRRMGVMYMEGLFQTMLGRVIGAAMPLLGFDRSMQRITKTWKAAQPMMDIEARKQDDGTWIVTLREDGVIPEFCAGLLEGGAAPLEKGVRCEVVERSPKHCVLALRRGRS